MLVLVKFVVSSFITGFTHVILVGMQVADVPRSAPLKTRLMWPALALTAAMVATQVGSCLIVGALRGCTS
jgi:hypothetical protein